MIPGIVLRCRCAPYLWEPLPATSYGVESARGSPSPLSTLNTEPTLPRVECRALSTHSNGREQRKRGSGQSQPLVFLFLLMSTPPGGKHCCGHPSISSQHRLRLSTRSPCYTKKNIADSGNRIAYPTKIAHTRFILVCNEGSYNRVR